MNAEFYTIAERVKNMFQYQLDGVFKKTMQPSSSTRYVTHSISTVYGLLYEREGSQSGELVRYFLSLNKKNTSKRQNAKR